ncbi:hypothetical protein [Rhizobium sp. FY34]|uniref:hypothetical protein n=1 Tax=Rhizobium sp. FY34 TaxID=2562309 RepID=UPI0010BFDE6D|nr:hypothetical protein [Rhizobium sp. FY34]
MLSNNAPLSAVPDHASFAAVSDESCLRDAGTSAETTSGAPVGCWANEAKPNSDETTQAEHAETEPAGCRPDEGDERQAHADDDGTLSVNAPGGPSEPSSTEPKTAADAIKSRRDFEAFLRTNGFSRAAAKAIAANGWASIGEDKSSALDDLADMIRAQTEELRQWT